MAATGRISLGCHYSQIKKLGTAITQMERACGEMKVLIDGYVRCPPKEVNESLPLTVALALAHFAQTLFLRNDAVLAISYCEVSISTASIVSPESSPLFSCATHGSVMALAHTTLIHALIEEERFQEAVDWARKWLAAGENEMGALEALTHALLHLAERLAVHDTALGEAKILVLRRVNLLSPEQNDGSVTFALSILRAFQDEAHAAHIRRDHSAAEAFWLATLHPTLVTLLDSASFGRLAVGKVHGDLGSLLVMDTKPPQAERAAVHLHESLLRCERGRGANNSSIRSTLRSLGFCYKLKGDFDRALLYADRWKNLAAKRKCANTYETAAAMAFVNQLSQLRHQGGTAAPVDASIILPAASTACDQCGTRSGRLTKCGRCGDAHYCSPKCQLADWATHQRKCGKLSKPAAAETTIPWAGPDDPWLD